MNFRHICATYSVRSGLKHIQKNYTLVENIEIFEALMYNKQLWSTIHILYNIGKMVDFD